MRARSLSVFFVSFFWLFFRAAFIKNTQKQRGVEGVRFDYYLFSLSLLF